MKTQEILWEILNAHTVDIEGRVGLVKLLFPEHREEIGDTLGGGILRELRRLENSEAELPDHETAVVNCDEPDLMLELR